MAVPDSVLELVERFEHNRTAYKSEKYNEAQLRLEFLNPFFEALGWDVNNRSGYAEAYKDVVNEDAIKVGKATKAPDYSFRIGGTRKFFVEAKKPAVNLKEASEPAFQLRRYAWSAKLPLSILTDFEEFAIYDCRYKPDQHDRASTARIMYLPYTEYANQWDDIYNVFSRNAILKGSFDSYAEDKKGKHGTAEVDSAFLQEIESWRDVLAHQIALRNKTLTQRELNFAVQMTIDRIIFLRICEDRGIEEYERLKALLKGTDVYTRLMDIFEEADARYNSGLFHFHKEKDFPESPDTLTPNLVIDDKPLKDIVKRLYYPESPYEFSALPSNVLGQVYEQFLGKVIRLSSTHKVDIEEKPEVRKAGGVYYTPTFIVEYIVKETLSKLLEGKKPGPKGSASQIKIVDPSCGSGSFLLVAYQYLLDWHRDRYVEDGADKHRKELYQGVGGLWFLTTQEKKRILLNSIYGVDIDSQAVEVTKLSLLLKVLENESNQSLVSQLSLFKERALPDLERNIKCGNSLIDSNFYDVHQLPLFDEEIHYRVNAFDWKTAFPTVFSSDDPGFDAVIGNPPYIRIQALKEFAPLEVEYYKKLYQTASKGNYDIYVVFVEKGLSLLNQHGRLGYILPHKFFNAQYGEPLRALLSEDKYLAEVVHFGDKQIFDQATTYTCLLFLNKAGSEQCRVVKVDDLVAWRNIGEAPEGVVLTTNLSSSEWNFSIGEDSELFAKLTNMPLKLGKIASIFVGLQTSADTVFLFKDAKKMDGALSQLFSKELNRYVALENNVLKPVVRSGNIGRYWINPTALLLFPYFRVNDKFKLIPETIMKADYPNAWNYLQANKGLLSGREHGKFDGDGWYQLYPKNLDLWEQHKILLPYMIKRLSAFYDVENNYFVNVTTGGFGITLDENIGSMEYITGLLNSKLLDWFFKRGSTTFHGGYFAANKQFVVQLPIRAIDFSDQKEKFTYDQLVNLAEQAASLQRRLLSANLDQERIVLKQLITTVEKKIDKLVYELYRLTEDEIRLVEGMQQQ